MTALLIMALAGVFMGLSVASFIRFLVVRDRSKEDAKPISLTTEYYTRMIRCYDDPMAEKRERAWQLITEVWKDSITRLEKSRARIRKLLDS